MQQHLVLGSAFTLLCVAPSVFAQPVISNHHEVKYVILMVPDGMNLSSVTAARISLNGITGAPLNIEKLERIGYQRTYSQKNTVTDSSAAASTWACGEKFVNNEVCLHIDGRPNNRSLLELAKARGMSTGLVATQTLTHATPAAFGAHVYAPAGISPRSCETEIAKQYVTITQPNVLLGGGRSKFNPATPDNCGAIGDYIQAAKDNNYKYIGNRSELTAAVADKPVKLLGLFDNGPLPELPSPAPQWLPQMTDAALKLLEDNKTGFFLLVEGSLIDDANHKRDKDYLVREMSAFDNSVKKVLDWIAAKPDRIQHTLFMVLPDHETGAVAVHGTERPAGEPFGSFFLAYTWQVPPEPETHHTGGDVVFWVQGPGSEVLARPIENTDVYHVIKALLRY